MKSKASNYTTIFYRTANQLNGLLLSMVIIIASLMFNMYEWHFGNSTANKKAYREMYKTLNEGVNRGDIIKYYGPIYCDKYSDSEPGETCIDTIRKELKEKLLSSNQNHYSLSLPFLSLPNNASDYFVFCILIGTVFISWIYTLLSYSRNSLKEYFNAPDLAEDIKEDSNMVSSIYFLLFPLSRERTFYKYIETILYIFWVIIFLVILSDLVEIFCTHEGVFSNGSLRELPGFVYMGPFIIIRMGLLIICLLMTIGFILKSQKILKDIRNLLILIRWQHPSFFNALYHHFEKEKNIELQKKENHIGYRYVNLENGKQGNKMSIRITPKNKNEGDTGNFHSSKSIHLSVDLAKTLKDFFKKYKMIPSEYFDEGLNRFLTFEEVTHQDFFSTIFHGKEFKSEFKRTFEKELENEA